MLLKSLRYCVLACVLCAPALAWAETLILTIEVKNGQHRLIAAQTIDRNVSSPPRSTPDQPQLLVEARSKEGGAVYVVKMDNHWDAPTDEHQHMPAPDSYVLRIPKGELVESVRVSRAASDRSSQPATVLIDVKRTSSGWR